MTHDTEELSPALSALLDGERARSDEVPADAKSAAARALFGGASLPSPGETRTGRWMRQASRLEAIRRALPWITFVIGAGTGGALHAALSEPPPEAPHAADAPLASPAPAEAPARPPAPAKPAITPDSLPNAPAEPMGQASTHAGGALDDERTWLDRARSALARGEPRAANAALEAHRRAYPNGALAEERDYLAIETAEAAHDSAEASKLRDAFRRDYPDSMLLGAPAASSNGR